MAKERSMKRLLRVLEIEEEQAEIALASAVADLRLLEQRADAAAQRIRSGRQLVVSSAFRGDASDRWAGQQESSSAMCHISFLRPLIAEAELAVTARRDQYFARRVDRRQAETLLNEAMAREAAEAGRTSQQGLDDWYLNRLHRRDAEKEQRKNDGKVESADSRET